MSPAPTGNTIQSEEGVPPNAGAAPESNTSCSQTHVYLYSYQDCLGPRSLSSAWNKVFRAGERERQFVKRS